ncbi:MAG TPA: redoxin family protein [Prolixibacteraceae bacterium]|nr:redoxin family protein [Prolixibacteraceae bacterium]
MRHLTLIILVFWAISASAQFPVISIGDQLPKSEKMDCATSNKNANIDELKGENGTLVIFSCNTCPFVVAWEDRFPIVDKIAKENKVNMVLVNSNYNNRNGVDSFEAMKAHAQKNNYKWPYLIDNESELANAFGAQTTPHVFLFDKNNKLVYKGAIDDNHKDRKQVNEFYLQDALNSLGQGKEISNKETRNLGCSIKRKTS